MSSSPPQECQQRVAHDPASIIIRTEIELLGEVRHVMALRHLAALMCEISAPEAAAWSEGCDERLQMLTHVAIGIGLVRKSRSRRKLDRNVWIFRIGRDQCDPLANALVLRSAGCEPHVINHQSQLRIALCDLSDRFGLIRRKDHHRNVVLLQIPDDSNMRQAKRAPALQHKAQLRMAFSAL